MSRIGVYLLLLVLALSTLACAPPAARPPARYSSPISSQIREEQSFPRPRALTRSLHLDVGASEEQMAADFAQRVDAATHGCAVRQITHVPGSAEVDVDLGAGCKAGSGRLRARFSKSSEGAEVAFKFRDFSHDGYFLDGAVATWTTDGEVFSFDGTLPWKELGDSYRPSPLAVAWSGGSGGGFGFGAVLATADVIRRVLTTLVLRF